MATEKFGRRRLQHGREEEGLRRGDREFGEIAILEDRHYPNARLEAARLPAAARDAACAMLQTVQFS